MSDIDEKLRRFERVAFPANKWFAWLPPIQRAGLMYYEGKPVSQENLIKLGVITGFGEVGVRKAIRKYIPKFQKTERASRRQRTGTD